MLSRARVLLLAGLLLFGLLLAVVNLQAQPAQAASTVNNVRDFGAMGDGVTDDTAAIQRAIDQAGTTPVYLPAGTYKVSDSGADPAAGGNAALKLRNGLTIYGDGSSTVIRLQGGNDWTRVLGASGVSGIHLHDFKIDVNAASGAIIGTGEQRHGIFLTGCKDSLIEGLTITQSLGDGIFLYGGSQHITVQDCAVIAGTTTNPRVGINVQGGSNCVIQRNNVTGYSCAYKAEIDEGDSDSVGNQILDNRYSGGTMGLGLNGSSTGKVKGYTVARNNFDLPAGADEAVWLSRTRDCTFSENVMNGATTGLYLVFDNKNLLVQGNRWTGQTYSALVMSDYQGYGASDGIQSLSNIFTSANYAQGAVSIWAADITNVEVAGNAYPVNATLVNNVGKAPSLAVHDNVTGTSPVIFATTTTTVPAPAVTTTTTTQPAVTTTTTTAAVTTTTMAPAAITTTTTARPATTTTTIAAPAPAPTPAVTPAVTITSPLNRSSIPRGTVTIQAAVSRPVAVWKVAFYIDGRLRSTDYLSPFGFAWNTRSLVKGSTHSVKVIAYDLNGVTLGQATATVTVK